MVNAWVVGKAKCIRLTDDDDEDPRHYLEGQGEGDESQHRNVVPEEGAEQQVIHHTGSADDCRNNDASAASHTCTQLPAR